LDLNELIGREFWIKVCSGAAPRMQALLFGWTSHFPPLESFQKGRGGLRALILSDGIIWTSGA
jgi:hypothetical protein